MTPQRRTRVRLLLRDLAAASAFASMGLSGELPLWALGVFGLSLALALLGLRPLAKLPVVSGVLLAVSALALYGGVGAGSMDLVVAACAFASLITAQRMLSLPGPRTDHQVLLTSLLMISGGAALSGELLFALALIGFAALSCFTLLLGVLDEAAGKDAALKVRPAAKATAWGLLAALLGAAVLFALFPRLSWNVAGRRASRGFGVAQTGLNESGVSLSSSGGSIKTNPRVVARAFLEPDPGRERLDAYFLAGTYGTFTGSAWTDDRLAAPPKDRVFLRDTEGLQKGDIVKQRIELLPAYGAQTAIALVEPVLLGGVRTQLQTTYGQSRMVHRPGQDVRMESRADAYTYRAFSAQRPQELPPPPPLTDEERARHLALPDGLDPRVAQLAEQVGSAESDPLRLAHRLEAYLKRTYAYSLDLPETEGDPLASFLFERRQGHCEYFASALAVMLRARGVPSRVATGFFGGERSGEDGAYLIRAGDAHAWTQVWIDGRGFVNLDATPESGRSARPQRLLAWALRQYERVESWWRLAILEYSLRDQFQIARGLFSRDRDGRGHRHGEAAAQGEGSRRDLWLWGAAAVLALYAAWRYRRFRKGRPTQDAAASLRARAEVLLARHGVALDAEEGFEDLALRLGCEGHPAAKALGDVKDAWLRARFGGGVLPPPMAEALLRHLESALRQSHPAPDRRAA